MKELTKEQLASLETPCIVADLGQVRRNIADMQRAADEQGVALRPHIKTHKLPLVALMQVAAGAVGITCAKVSEAEALADGGLDDIFIAYPLIGEKRIQRAIALSRRLRRLILAVDSLEGAQSLDQAARASGVRLAVRIEVDLGGGRTGAPLPQAIEVGQAITRMAGLQAEGIYGYKSMVYAGKPTTDRALAAREEGELLHQAAEALRAAGVRIESVSGGSTPTGPALAATGQVTEIRPGTYIYKDITLERSGVAQHDELALCYVATVVSCHHEGYAVIDGGSKTFQTDIALHTPPANYDSYAVIEGHDNLRLTRLYEEHGIVTALDGHTGLKVGDRLRLYPIHACTAVNMHNAIYLLEEDGSLRREVIPARGMLA